MRNTRLTIFPLAMILMTACGDTAATEPEMLDMTGSWLVQTWIVTQVAAPMTVVDVFNPPSGRVLTDAGRYLYDDGTLLSINNFPDTVRTGTEPPDEIFLDASEYLVNTWCVALAADVSFCEGAAVDELIVDPGGTDELTWTFVRNGDHMTINGADEYDFGAGDEDATFVMTLDRIIVEVNRPPLLN